MKEILKDKLVVVRGGGDLATGTILKLFNSGFPVVVIETRYPSAIRRQVAFSEAVYNKTSVIENVTCRYLYNIEETEFKDDVKLEENMVNEIKKGIYHTINSGEIPLITDGAGSIIKYLKPWAVVDAIIAKKNLGTNKSMAPVTIGLGPGFCAGKDVNAVIETMRGHRLGRIIYEGSAIPDTKTPGMIGGYTKERVIHAPVEGIIKGVKSIGDVVKKDDCIAVIYYGNNKTDKIEVKTEIPGIIRGLIRDDFPVTKGFKIADVDPRENELKNCFTVSDKARCIAGGVLEALMHEI